MDTNNSYLVSCYLHNSESAIEFIKECERRANDEWRDLADAGHVTARVLFEFSHAIGDEAQEPPFSFVLVSRLSNPKDARLVSKADASGMLGDGLQRSESLHAVKGSNLPQPDDSHELSAGEVFYRMEFIDVNEADRMRYHDIMENFDGDAKKDMIRRGFMYCFFGLETQQQFFVSQTLLDWNVIHIMGLDDAEKYRELPAQFDIALRNVNPQYRHAEIYRELPTMRTKRRHFISRMLPAASVGNL